MLEQHEIDHLLAIGRRQFDELMGIGRPATAPGSDPGEVEAASTSPAIPRCPPCDVGIPCPPNWRSCRNYMAGGPGG